MITTVSEKTYLEILDKFTEIILKTKLRHMAENLESSKELAVKRNPD